VQLGESFVGTGADAAHVNTVLGPREGPVGTAWATALATPSAGHAPFVVVLRPGVPVRPFTLFVNKARVETEEHARLTWGAAQAGIAAGVARAVREEVVADLDQVLIAAVWVDPAARDEGAVHANNAAATLAALAMGQIGGPSEDELLAAAEEVWNPFFRSR
jgi:5,6,7,8-tetrahydromethanopterin hydro-lyase